MSDTVYIYTDGACKGNPGPGGWGVLLRFKGQDKELFGGEADTTNNRMELRAAIEGIRALKRPCKIVLTTDSSYVKNGIESWLKKWVANDWRTANRKPVKNQDLWRELNAEVESHDVSWRWVKGHSGHEENEIADMLANRGVEEYIV